MAVISPPFVVQGGEHDAKVFRQTLAGILGQSLDAFVNSATANDFGHGLARQSVLQVAAQASPNMTVQVSKGVAFIAGDSVTSQGVYGFVNDATENVTIAAADGSNPRWDLIVAQVRDNEADASGEWDARLTAITGTPSATPADPVIPPGCLVLARVVVGTGVISITNANITNLAKVAKSAAWARPRGIIAIASKTSDQIGVSSIADISSLSVAFTAETGRSYRISLHMSRIIQRTAASTIVTTIADGSNNVMGQTYESVAINDQTSTQVVSYESGITGAQTRKGRISTSSGTVDVDLASTYPSYIVVEDLGATPS